MADVKQWITVHLIFWKHTGKSFTINYDDFIKSTNPSLSYEDAIKKEIGV